MAKSLDEQYLAINRLYLHKNFHRDAFSIFGHLVEVMGGLSLLSSNKQKPDVDTEAYFAKAFAWWFALCGKVGVKSPAQMIWAKFPDVCPYCRQTRCITGACAVEKAESRAKSQPVPDWSELDRLAVANLGRCPQTLGEFCIMFNRIYDPGVNSGYERIFARFTEELGELAETIRVFPLAPGYFLSEASDVFAWLCHLFNKYAFENKVKAPGIYLDSLFEKSYPGACSECGSALCACPPILHSTLGRIAGEIPPSRANFSNSLYSIEEIQRLFSSIPARVRVGDREEDGTAELVRQAHSVLRTMAIEVSSLRVSSGGQNAMLLEIIEDLAGLTSREALPQQKLDELLRRIDSLDKNDSRGLAAKLTTDFLTGTNASLFATLMVEYIKIRAGTN